MATLTQEQSGQVRTFLWGSLYSLLLVFLPSYILTRSLLTSIFERSSASTGVAGTILFLLPILIALMPAVLFFAAGLRRPIPIGFVGVRKFLKKRLENAKLVCEGYSWLFPGFMSAEEVDVRPRPLNPNASSPEDLEVEIDGQMKPKKIDGEDGVEQVPVLGIVRVAAQVQTVDPYTYLGVSQAEAQLMKTLESRVRIEIAEKDPLTLPQEKSILSARLLEILQPIALRSGLRITRLDITDVRQPDDIEKEAQDFAKERVQRRSKEYQSETWNQTGATLKKQYKDLSDQETMDAVLVGDGRASKSITSIQGLDRAAGAFGTALGKALSGILSNGNDKPKE